MSPANVGTIEQEAGTISGSGKMVGIEVADLTGDVYIEKISQVQIVILTPEGRKASAEQFIDVSTRPYKSLYPYTAKDEALFRGRTEEVERIVKIIHGQRLLVVYGQAGVGKTSLLAAGVMPALAREGALTIQIQDYSAPEKTILDGLSASAKHLSLDLPEGTRLPVLLDSIIKQTKGTLVLVLDQFELLFEPSISDEQRNNFIDDLMEVLRTIEGRLLRVIIVARNEALEKLGEMDRRSPKLLQCPVQLLPLTRAQARAAIEEPLYVVKPETRTIFEGDLVEAQLLPDLDELTESDPGFIHPQHLQIVCEQLYLKARAKGHVRVINDEIYSQELEGSDSILASFIQTLLDSNVPENQRGRAVQLLAIMASPGAPRWIKPAEFEIADVNATEIEDTLERLVKARFLIRSYDGGKAYSLVSPMITFEIRRLAGTGKQVEQRYNAEGELERIWHTWLALEHFASREQVRYLAKSGEHLEPRAVKMLLLLRSAVEQDEQARTWVERLRGDTVSKAKAKYKEGKELIEQLEMPDHAVPGQRIGSAALVKAQRLLGFSKEETAGIPAAQSPASSPQNAAFGPIAQKAVDAPLSNVRQACALALTAIDPVIALNRLDAALKGVSSTWRRRKLRAELRGTLADADPKVEQLNSNLPVLQRLFIWDWRARRRISRESRRLAWLTVGGAIGSGLGVGLLRAILAVPPDEQRGQEFGIYFFFAGTLGAALSYGVALANPLQHTPTREAHDGVNPTGTTLRTALLSIALGTTLFGTAHLFLASLNGVPLGVKDSYFIVLMGFILGLGLSAALSYPIRTRRHSQALDWVIRFAIAGITFALVYEFFLLVSDYTANNSVLETQITRGTDYMKSILEERNPPYWLSLFKRCSDNPQILASFHGVLTGIFMITGLTLGLSRANKSLTKRQNKRNGL